MAKHLWHYRGYTKQVFYDHLKQIISTLHDHKLILMGDFNARTGRDHHKT